MIIVSQFDDIIYVRWLFVENDFQNNPETEFQICKICNLILYPFIAWKTANRKIFTQPEWFYKHITSITKLDLMTVASVVTKGIKKKETEKRVSDIVNFITHNRYVCIKPLDSFT